MKTRKLFHAIFIIFILVIFSSCQEIKDTKSELQNIMNTDKAFSDFAQEKGLDLAFSEFADSNAIKLPGKGHPIKGKEKIKNSMPTFNKNLSLVWEPLMGEISQSCDLGYTLGKYVVTVKDSSGIEKKGYGYYVSIWKKQDNGSWKWIIDLGNESEEPTHEDIKFLE
ncbi:MAG: hypothetical protein JXA68_02320 [Ignavibacteriales bacterium]|nr:hypothetical protein [Ignavibacteriales bacterium]